MGEDARKEPQLIQGLEKMVYSEKLNELHMISLSKRKERLHPSVPSWGENIRY